MSAMAAAGFSSISQEQRDDRGPWRLSHAVQQKTPL
jgi:hypothetical protein